jgi:Branched-chain amino acid aminotransferase/4-amino-4-deoxychorismate lyase
MTKAPEPSTIDWKNLGFEYMDLPFRYLAHWKDGQWDEGELTEDSTLHISEGATALHYGQADFEGLKAYRTKNNEIQLSGPIKTPNGCKTVVSGC